jgi:DNA replication and repair protein RecF
VSEAILRIPSVRDMADTGVSALAPAAGPRLWLARLTLSEFRCYAHTTLETDGRPVVLCGPNGAGKTNLLEALSLLAPGRGLRRAKLSEVIRTDGGGSAPAARAWAVAARIETPEGPRDIGTGRDLGREPPSGEDSAVERRLVRIDGASVRGQQGLSEILSLVWLTPQMDSLLREAPGSRRRFLDRLVYGFDPAHAGRVAAYEQSLRERARLLKLGRADDAWLSALEDSMARHGVAIAAARRALVARLGAACAQQESAFPIAGLELEGEVEAWLDQGPALMAEDRLRAQLAKDRARDAETGGAAAGPHRADLIVRHVERGVAADRSSTGEQKALLISIVLAHARLLTLERGAPPLLLLDEVAAHLDARRRAALYRELLALGAQAWLTGTEAAVFAPLGDAAQFLRVENAELAPMPAADNDGNETI